MSAAIETPPISKPLDISIFQLTLDDLPAGPPSRQQPLVNPISMCLGVALVISQEAVESPSTYGRYFLVHPEEIELDETLHPVFEDISIVFPDEIPDDSSQHAFWFNTGLKHGSQVLSQLLDQDIVEFVHPIRTHVTGPQGGGEDEMIEYPLVRVKLTDKQMAKQCGSCEIWEQRTDKERLSICSRCRNAWWCDEECQLSGWKRGRPVPHKKLCRLVNTS